MNIDRLTQVTAGDITHEMVDRVNRELPLNDGGCAIADIIAASVRVLATMYQEKASLEVPIIADRFRSPDFIEQIAKEAIGVRGTREPDQ